MVNYLFKNNYRNAADTSLTSDMVCQMVAISACNKEDECNVESILNDDEFLGDTVDTSRR